MCSQELLAQQEESAVSPDNTQALIADHMRILLVAEHTWLQHAIAQLQDRVALGTAGSATKPASK